MATVSPDPNKLNRWTCSHAVSQQVLVTRKDHVALEDEIMQTISDELSKHNLDFFHGAITIRDDFYTGMRIYTWTQTEPPTVQFMNDKIYVIAGNYQEFQKYIKEDADKRVRNSDTRISLSHYVYVDSPEKLRGVRGAHGAFVGSYKQISNLNDIVTAISLSYAPDMDPISKYNEICQRIGLTS